MSGKITVMGGDRRFLSVKAFFEKNGFTVNTAFLGEEKRDAVYNTVIMPVPVFRNAFLNSPLTEKKVSENELYEILPENSEVFGGMIPEQFIRKCKEKNICFTDYYKDENLLNENAVLTAKAVPLILEENSISLKNGKVLVLGYGRCGRAIADIISSVGGNVTVVTSKSNADNHSFIHFENLSEKLSDVSLAVNTVPSTVLSENELVRFKRDAVLIEIASAPYGIDFNSAKRLDIKVIKAPSLPGRYFPVEAGEAIAKTILKELN